MTLPSLILALICSLLVGSLFHLLVDGGPARLMLYMILSAAGFGAGQWIATSQHWGFLALGPLWMGPAVLGSLLLLVVGHWLSKVEVQAVDNGDTA
jgi:uncharacterized membrane protein YeaQ/YmgE (transglycosylase-associated protein family)